MPSTTNASRSTPTPPPNSVDTGFSLSLPDERATVALGMRLSALLHPGDVVLLEGDLGAGKSTLARAVIRELLGTDEAIPSPTYTITAQYDTARGAVVHADLYRLSGPDELDEIGLVDGFSDAITLVEWPDRLEHLAPPDHLIVALAQDGAGRRAVVRGAGARGAAIVASLARPRAERFLAFLEDEGETDVTPVPGDASNRRYSHAGPHIAMDAPYALGEDVRPFVAVTEMLRRRGLSAPEIIAGDAADGFLLLENLGDGLFARLCADDPAMEGPLYGAAVDVLHALAVEPGDAVPPYDMAVMEREGALLTEWWCPAAGAGASADRDAEWRGLLRAAMDGVAGDRSALVLRDYHAENLLWLPERDGDARVGLLDYQDALIGHPAYDLVSLLEDARRDVSPGLAEAMIARFLARRGDLDAGDFRRDYDLIGAQRNAKIVGIFARLCVRDGKPRYLSMIPRVWAHLMRDLGAAPALREFVARYVPEPTADVLARIAAENAR